MDFTKPFDTRLPNNLYRSRKTSLEQIKNDKKDDDLLEQ